MKLKNLIKEATVTTTLPLRDIGNVTFLVTSAEYGFIFIPKTMDEADKIEMYKEKKHLDNNGISDILASYVWKKIGIPCKSDKKYQGAGFSVRIDIDTDAIIRKL